YFDSSKIMKSSTTNVETSINEEVFHEVSESFQVESSSYSLNDDVQQSPEEVIPPKTNTQSMSNNMIPNVNEESTSHKLFNKRLEDAYFNASTSFHDPFKVPIYCDSKSAIAISYNSIQHTRTKHIDVRYHFIKDHVEKGTIELYFVGTEYQLADLFTKSLPEARFKFLVEKLGTMSRET
nr:retrotransposon protein, putative, unclassified [Tanacetum cinerariifolium]